MIRRLAIGLALAKATTSHAQQSSLIPRPYAEYRVDAISAREFTTQAGAGLNVPVGIYARLALTGAVGATGSSGDYSLSGRTDAIVRFLFDPLRQTRWALSVGGGVSVPYEKGTRVRPLLTAVVDVEGYRRGGFTPALQVGLGGGVRVGVALRGSPGNRR